MEALPEHDFIRKKLENDLPATLQYHTISHTLDVFSRARHLGKAEGVSIADLRLLSTAAMYHDCGYLFQSVGHEAKSCEIAREVLPGFSYSDADIDVICKLIMATQVPQRPNNLLEEIICDADLDYLGRNDFYELAEHLFTELKALGVLETRAQWDKIQVAFLTEHRYFTKTAILERKPTKEKHLGELKKSTV